MTEPTPRGRRYLDEAIKAHVRYQEARSRRRIAFRNAYDVGLTYRQIAEGVGLSASVVHRLINRKVSPDDV